MPTPAGVTVRRRALLLVLVVVVGGSGVGVTASLSVPGVAAAHAVLESTVPAAGSAVATSPPRVELTFGEPVTLPSAALRVFDASGDRVDAGPAHHPGGEGTEVSSSLPALRDGSYVVAWKAISADSHPVSGAFTFSVGAASGDASGLVARYEDSGASRAVGVVHGAVRSVGYAAAALLIGGVALLLLCWPAGASAPRPRRWLRWAGVAGVVAALASIPLQAAYGEGDGIGQVLDVPLWPEVVMGRFGWAALARAAAFALGVALVSWLPRCRTAAWRAGALATALVIATSFALAGHGATGRWPIAGVVLDVVHVLAVSVWLGGLVGLLAWVLRDADVASSITATRRFSSVALWSVVAIVVSGGLQGVRQVGWSWEGLTTTTYGRLLLAKVALVLLVVLVAWASRRRLAAVPAADEDRTVPAGASDARRALRRTVAWESAGLLVVLVLSAVLSVTVPAREAVDLPFDQVVRSGAASAQISVLPARTGTNEIHVTVFGGAIPDLAEVDVELRLPERDVGPIDVPMTKITSNHYLTDHAVVPLPGEWRMTVQARVGDFDQDTFEVTVPVR